MEKIKLNPTSHSNTKNQYQDTDLNVYTKTIKLIEKKKCGISSCPQGRLMFLTQEEHAHKD